jgi:hypothetical protein
LGREGLMTASRPGTCLGVTTYSFDGIGRPLLGLF